MLGYFEVRLNARIEGSSRLWVPFQDPVAAWRAKPSPKRVLPIHPAGKRIDGRRHSHQEPTIVKREYEPRAPGIEGRMDSRPRLDVRKDGYAEEVKTVQPEGCELFTPGANFSPVYADEEIDLPFAKSHVCKDDGIPCLARDHRRARDWPARKRARLKRQMKISIGANGGCAMLARLLGTYPSDNRLSVHNAPAGVAVARAASSRSIRTLFPTSPDRQSQYTPTCRFTKPMSSRRIASSAFIFP